MPSPIRMNCLVPVAALGVVFTGQVFLFSVSLFGQSVEWAQNPSNPNNVVGNILAATNHYADRNNVQQPVGVASPNSFSQPTRGQTQAFIDQNPVLRNLDPMTKQSLIMGGQYGVPTTNVLNSPYINGQHNPFYQNGTVIPNWYLPSTWSPGMNWVGVQPNGFPANLSTYNPSSTRFSSSTTFNSSTSSTSPNTSYTYRPPPTYTRPTSSPLNQPTQQRSQPTGLSTSTAAARPLSQSSMSAFRPNLAQLATARASLERGLALSETAGDKVAQAANHAALAEIFVQQGQLELASAHVHAAESLSAVANPTVRAELMRAKVAVLMASGEFEKAIEAYQEASFAPRLLDDRAAEAELETSIGWAYQSMGNIPKALNSYEKARSLFNALGDKDGVVRTVLGTASLYQSLGEAEKALAEYRRVVLSATHEQVARIMVSAAEMSLSAGRPKEALMRYDRALAELSSEICCVLREPQDSALETSILVGIGRSHMALGDFHEAESNLDLAREKAKASGKPGAEAGVVASLGELNYWNEIRSPRFKCWTWHCGWEKPDLSKALKNYQEAKALMEAASDPLGEIGILTNIGLVYDARGESAAALGYYSDALHRMDDIERSARIEEFRIDIAGQSSSLYQRAIEIEVGKHRMIDAFNLTERARARTLLDQLGNTRIDLTKYAPSSFSEREKKLRRENIALERQLGQELAKPAMEVNPERTKALQVRLSEIRTDYEDAVNQLKISNPDYASFLSISTLTVRQAQQQLDANVTVLSYFATPQMVLAFVFTRNSFHGVELSVKPARLFWAVSTFRDFAGERNDSPTLRFLYKSLIEPVEGYLKTSKLIVVPYGPLHDLPFAALTPDGNTFLNDRYSISYLPSASILPYLRSRVTSSNERALIVANDWEPGVPLLSHAFDEARSVASLLGTQPLLGNEASTLALQTKASDSAIVHLIAHYQIDRNHPQFSRILFRQASGEDELSDFNLVASLDLRNTDLVVLSGCETQVGKRSRGDDVFGLSRAFIYAGAPSVIASLWSVDDEASKQLMVAFYSYLKKGQSKVEALRAAQIQVRQMYPNPYYWAGFILTGDPGEPGKTRFASTAKN